jgi:hypothetical protein
MSDIKYRNRDKRGMVVKEKRALPSQGYNSHRQVRVSEPEIVQGRNQYSSPSDGFIETLLNIYKEKTICKSRLNAQKEIYQKQADVLTAKIEFIKKQKELLKETLEMEWLRNGKYLQMLEQKFLSNGITPDREMLRETVLELLTELAEAEELDDE